MEEASKVIVRKWGRGMVTFQEGKTIEGLVRLDLVASPWSLEVVCSGNSYSIPYRDLKEFSFYDSIACKERSFAIARLKKKVEPSVVEYEFRTSSAGIVRLLQLKTVVHHHYYYPPHPTGVITPGVRVESSRNTHLKNDVLILNRTTGEALPLTRENLLRLFDFEKDRIIKIAKTHKVGLTSVDDVVLVLTEMDNMKQLDDM